jgi:hypothetical protein
MSERKTYIGSYKVVKIFRVSRRREVIRRNLNEEQAQQLVRSYPYNDRHMVVYFKQFYTDKYFV